MKILLINISLRPSSEGIYFPVGLSYIITSIHKAGFELEILDLDVLRLSKQEIVKYIKSVDVDVFAMGCIVTGYKYVKWLSNIIKEHHPNSIIIAGNSVATSIPQLLLTKTKVDICVLGEGDVTIVELLANLRDNISLKYVRGIVYKKNNIIHTTKQREIIDYIDVLPFINFDLFDMKAYLERFKYIIPEPYPLPFEDIRALPINTARGCPYQCSFCYHVFKGKKYRMRSVENIIKEVKQLQNKYGINYFHFADELSLPNKKRAKKLAEGLEKLDVYWGANCRVGLFHKEDINLLQKMKDSGCVYIGYSLESADPYILKAMNKHINVSDFIEQTEVIQKSGITATTSLVIGYPQETKETLQRTFDICRKCNIYPSVGYLLPQPGTEMYDLAIERGLIRNEEEYLLNISDRQDFQINFTTMTQELIEGIVEENLQLISEILKLKLNNLIKTGHYRGIKK